MASHADLLSYALSSMRHRQLRAWLTILGVIIGIASIVTLVGLASGLDANIKGQLGALGTNYVIVIPGNIGVSQGIQFGPPVFKGALYVRDAQALKSIPGVLDVSGNVALPTAKVTFKGQAATQSVIGVQPPAYEKFLTTGFESGRFITDGDVGSVVLGNDVANKLFDKKVTLGSTLTIEGRAFRVKGILKKVGQTGSNVDSAAIIDSRAARDLLGTGFDKNRVLSILAVTQKDAVLKDVATRVKDKLRDLHKVAPGKEDFTVLTAESIGEQIGQITGLLSLFLGGVAMISLAVGGVGIANAMFTSVLERTSEIGILKSIGASDPAILELFLLESGLIGIAGGVIGVLVALALSALLQAFGVPSLISWQLIAFALLFSFAVGLASGYFPAKNASQLQPVQALKHE